MDCVSSPVILRGNCFDLLKEQPASHFDLLITDPPYGTTNLPFDKVKLDWKLWWKEINRVCRPNAVQVVFAAQPFTTDLISANRTGFGYDLVWSKPNSVGFLNAKKLPLRSHESILIFKRRSCLHRGHAVYNPQMTEGTPYTHRARRIPAHYSQRSVKDAAYRNEGTRYPTSILYYGRDQPSLHPTAKPIELLRWLVRTYSHSGDRVLDCFMGAGSTGVACVAESRQFVGMELDEEYFEIARGRLHPE